jgi:tRNA(Ile)-lysidine synthase
LRPLLDIEKTKILEYLDAKKLHYFIDETNTDTDIMRNKMRHEILPSFSEIHPNHKKNIKNLLDYFEELKENIDQQVENFFSLSSQERAGVSYENNSFQISDFNILSPLLQKEVIREIFYKSNGNSTI